MGGSVSDPYRVIPRIVEVRENGRFIAKHHGFITIRNGDETCGQVPLDDIGVFMISAFGATCTKDALVGLADRGAVTILCGANGNPAAYVIPTVANYENAERLRIQIGASQPLRKRLWQALVEAKLRHQAHVLGYFDAASSISKRILNYSEQVKSGDPDNREACGARLYWQALFGSEFRRNPEGPWPNPLLNYGYAVLRASVTRAICATGLNPGLGVHHNNSTNTFPLADDLMEPYRPLVDYYAKKAVNDGLTEMNPASKQAITRFIWADLRRAGEATSFFNGVERLAYSIFASFKNKKLLIEIAALDFEGADDDSAEQL